MASRTRYFAVWCWLYRVNPRNDYRFRTEVTRAFKIEYENGDDIGQQVATRFTDIFESEFGEFPWESRINFVELNEEEYMKSCFRVEE